MIWWLLQPRQRAPRAERQRHGDQRALVRQEDPERSLVQPPHGFRRAEPGEPRRDREHQADLGEREREGRVVRRVQVGDGRARNADRRQRIAAVPRQQRVPEHAQDEQWRTGDPPACQRVAELPGRPPHRVREHQHQRDRDEHTPRVLVQLAHQRFQRQQDQVDDDEPQRCRDQVTDVVGGALVDTAHRQSEEDSRPRAEHQQRWYRELLQPDEEGCLRASGRVAAHEEEQAQRLQHPRHRCQLGQVLERAVYVHARRCVHERGHEPVAEHDRDDGDRTHGVDEWISHGLSPEAIRTSAISVSLPGS
ncbi:hypothetical protein C8D88_109393 [Lentzea atacamensis]|uniref:Uncharacterized protein n=1 Tax=Lentzea atacamensis TaxID=531938 RepID=A0A316I1L2_9PSEU|nr:hypothetical protein C8D88_109393 [Lentzea atacamensis]